MAPNIKFDLSNTVKEVGELNKALESLGAVAQGIFSNLDRLGQSFSSNMQGMAQTSKNIQPATPSDFLSPAGQKIAGREAEQSFARASVYAETSRAIESGSAFVAGGHYRVSNPTAAGTQQKKLMSVEDYDRYKQEITERKAELDKRASDPEYAKKSQLSEISNKSLEQSSAATQEQASKLPAQASSAYSTMNMDAIGISLADVPKAMKSVASGADNKALESVAQSIRQLGISSEKTDATNATIMRETAKILEVLRDDVKNSSAAFSKAAEKFTELSSLKADDPRRMAAQQELLAATGRRQRSMEQLESATRDADEMTGGGGGGGGGRGATLARAARITGQGLSIAATGLGAYAGYLGLENAADQAVYGATLAAEQYKGQRVQTQFRQSFEQADRSNAENLFKYRADILFPDEKFKFVGMQGLDKATELATQQEQDRREIEARSTEAHILGSVASMAGAGAALGGTVGSLGMGIGAVPGAVIGTLGGAAAGLFSGVSDYLRSPSTAYSGDLEESTIGKFLGGDKFTAGAKEARRREQELSRKNIVDTADQLMNAEVQQNPYHVKALQEILAIENAEKTAAVLVGGSGMSMNDIANIYKDYTPRQILKPKEILNPEAPLQVFSYPTNPQYQLSTEIKQYEKSRDAGEALDNADKTGLLDSIPGLKTGFEALSNLLSSRDSSSKLSKTIESQKTSTTLSTLTAHKFKEDGLTFNADEVVKANEAMLKPYEAPPKPSKMSVFAELEMTSSEFITHNAHLTNAFNKEATAAQTRSMIRLGRSGLGSYEQLLGNVTQLGAVTGEAEKGQQKLEEILTNAVSIGFDKSRLAQTFVQTTTSLAEGMKSRDVEQVSEKLALSSTIMGATVGKADELSLKLAAQGMQSFESFTRDQSGAVGAFKAMGAMAAGADVGKNLFGVMGMGANEMENAISQIDRKGGVIDPKIAQMLAIEREDLRDSGLTGPALEDAAKAKLKEKFSSSSKQLFGFTKNVVENVSKVDTEAAFEEIKNSTGEERNSKIQALLGQYGQAGSQIRGLGEEGAKSALFNQMQDAGLLTAQEVNNRSKFTSTVNRGVALYADRGKQELRRFIDDIVSKDIKTVNATVQESEIKEYFDKGGTGMYVGDEYIQSAADLNKLGSSPQERQRKIEQAGLSRLDFAKSADVAQSAQAVRVINFGEITKIMQNASPNSKPERSAGN